MGCSVYAQKDVTAKYIKNANLSSLSGWTNKNFNNPVKGNNTIGYASESYAGWDNVAIHEYSLTQEITLPKGKYTLVNYSFFRYGQSYDYDNRVSLAYLKAGDKEVAIKTLEALKPVVMLTLRQRAPTYSTRRCTATRSTSRLLPTTPR